MPPAPGDYEISVDFKGTFGGVAGPVRGSPVTATFQKGQPAENNTMPGPAMIKETIADVNTLLQFATKVSHRLLPAQFEALGLLVFLSIARSCRLYDGLMLFPVARLTSLVLRPCHPCSC